MTRITMGVIILKVQAHPLENGIFSNVPGGEDFADINEDKSGKRIGERIKK